jgi:putative transposase
VSKRVSPTDRLRAEVDELFGSGRDLAAILEDVARVSVQLMLQTALEAEVDAFLGRGRYQRRDPNGPAQQPQRLAATDCGAHHHGRGRAAASQAARHRPGVLLPAIRSRGDPDQRVGVAGHLRSGWVRGLSDRDIKATLAEVLGPEAALSRSTVSRICQRLREEFTAWQSRDLSSIRLDYLFLDASHFRMHPGAPAEPVLCAWGIDVDGKPVFVGLAPAASESTDAWDDFLADLIQRGLRAPLLGISDGAPGLTGAFDRAFPTSLRQRCLVHRARNTLAKVSARDQDEVKADFWAIFDVGDAEPGEEAVAVAHRQAAHFAAKWQRRDPSAVACVTDDLASLTVHLRFPAEHWRRIRHSNFIERTIWRDPPADQGDRPAPRREFVPVLVWAVLDRASRGWRGLTMTPRALRLLQDLRRQLLHPPADKEVIDQAVTAAA